MGAIEGERERERNMCVHMGIVCLRALAFSGCLDLLHAYVSMPTASMPKP